MNNIKECSRFDCLSCSHFCDIDLDGNLQCEFVFNPPCDFDYPVPAVIVKKRRRLRP